MFRFLSFFLVLSPALIPAYAAAAPRNPGPERDRIPAIEALLEGRADDTSLSSFIADHLAPEYVKSFSNKDELLEHLRDLHARVGGVGSVGVTVDNGRFRLHVNRDDRTSVVAFALQDAEPFRIVELVLESSGVRDRGPELTWDTLESSFEDAVAKGFCGSILAVHDGKVVLDRGFGHADPGDKYPVTSDTLFAIGSTPIDFTHGGILMLEEAGSLSLSDPLERFFDDVPADKRGITLEHLRTGRSGLLDFPGIEGVDENLDLSWIDRDEFMRRVFASELLFEPGTSERHSHTAWGVLAAVIEIVADQGYDAFLRENFFGPAGMQHTGDYTLTKKFPASEVAVGLGGNTWGKVNSPQHWGETSWLVLGSGGMVSTPGDLYRWRKYLASEGLGETAKRKYGIEGVFLGEGGNDRGFINTLGYRGKDAVIVCSNSQVDMDDYSAKIANSAARLATGD